MTIRKSCAGARRVNGGVLRLEYDFVEPFLSGTEFAIHREGARDVRRIAIELAAGINQDQITITQFCIAGSVMQHAGIGTGCHD